MKKSFILLAMIAGFSQTAFASETTTVKSVEYIGQVTGAVKRSNQNVCKLTISLMVFENAEHPGGPVRYEFVDYRMTTAEDLAALEKVEIWNADAIQRTNATDGTSYSQVSAIPMGLGKDSRSEFDGSTLYKKTKLGDSIYTGKREVWISNVSANVFDSKPTSVRVLQKGGTFVALKTEADFTCRL